MKICVEENEVTLQYTWTCSPLGQRMLTDLSGNSFNDSKIGVRQHIESRVSGGLPT